MFGKPVWFRKRSNGRGVSPVTWQGWLYFAVWAAVILLPCLLFAGVGRWPETLIWAAIAGGGLFWDIRQVQSQMGLAAGEAEDDVLYIGDDAENARVATRSFDLQMRD